MTDFLKQNPLLRVVLLFAAGIYLAQHITGSTRFYFFLAVILILSFILSVFSSLKIRRYSFFLLLILSGFFRLALETCILPGNHISFHRTAQIDSVVLQVESFGTNRYGTKRGIGSIRKIYEHGIAQAASGKILFRGKELPELKYGDIVLLSGKVSIPPGQRNPGQFDYRRYLVRRGIHRQLEISDTSLVKVLFRNKGNPFRRYIITPVHDYIESTLTQYLTEHAGGITRALILGEKQGLDPQELKAFQRSGVVHVLAISGLHVGYIILFIYVIFKVLQVGFRKRIILIMLVLFVYVALVDFRAPVIRASLMAVLLMGAKIFERRYQVFNVLSGAALIILLFDPAELFNPGFQFSFAAVAAIVGGYPQLKKIFPLDNIIINRLNSSKPVRFVYRYIWQPLLVSLAAVLGTLPLSVYYYGLIPVVAVFANLIIIPAIGLALLLSLVILITAAFSTIIAANVGIAVDWLLNFTVFSTGEISAAGFGIHETMRGNFLLTMVLVFIAVTVFMFDKPAWRWRTLILMVATSFLFAADLQKPPDFTEVTFFDVGQGDACFIRTSTGYRLLVDAGGKNDYLNVTEFLKNLGVLHLNYAVASHPHDDHIGGMAEVLSRLQVDTLVTTACKFDSKVYNNLMETAVKRNTFIRRVKRGDRLFAGHGTRIYILNPAEEFLNHDSTAANDVSIVLKIEQGESGLLLPGDAERAAEKRMSSFGEFLESEILKTAHHGSNTSTGPEFLSFVYPRIAVIPVAERNRFGHPSAVVLERLKQLGTKIYLTSTEGAVRFRMYENRIVKTEWRTGAPLFAF